MAWKGWYTVITMNRLSRYLFFECATTSVVALMVLTFFIMLPQVLHLVDLWVNKGVSVSVLGKMTLLAIPQFMVAAIPMALLMGILLAMGRLAQDSELVVLKACGLSLYQIMRPIALLVILYTVLSLILNMVWMPYSFHLFSVLKKALVSSTTLALKPQTFNHAIPGLTIYVEEQNLKNRVMKGILIHDQRNPDNKMTLTARSGRIHLLKGGGTALSLQEGSRHQKVGFDHYRQLRFSTYTMDLGISLGLNTRDITEQLDELNVNELRTMMRHPSPEKAYEARMEWHRRLSFPIATLILGLFAVPLGLQQSQRSGRSYGFTVAVLALIFHFMLLSSGEAMARNHTVDPLVGFWLPNLIMTVLTGYVMVLTSRGRPLAITHWLSQMLATLPLRLLRSSSSEPR